MESGILGRRSEDSGRSASANHTPRGFSDCFDFASAHIGSGKSGRIQWREVARPTQGQIKVELSEEASCTILMPLPRNLHRRLGRWPARLLLKPRANKGFAPANMSSPFLLIFCVSAPLTGRT